MPYQRLLDDLVQRVAGAEGALLLDPTGELVAQAGDGHERHRLIGAYQGIALARARSVSGRHSAGEVRHLVCRYAGGAVILRPLKDGYYLVLSLGTDASVGEGLHRSAGMQHRINAEL
jgi:predicted regulator of Ras-like GTPase activity (Roadblock/LC7/MglB family)